MPTPESKVKKKVKELLKKFGCYQHWPVQHGYGAPCLDCHACHKGHYFAVETKAPGKKLTPRQELSKAEVEEAGGVVFVVGERELDVETLSARYKSQFVYSGMEELYEWLSKH